MCVATGRHVSFLFEGDLKEKKKKNDIKIKNKLFFNNSFLTYLIANIYIHV